MVRFYKENLLNIMNRDNVNHLDFKDWIMLYEDCDENLKKWIRYKACDYPDPDEVLKQDALECVAIKLKWYHEPGKYYLDCIFSFTTFFKAFMRYYAGEYMPHMGQIYENYEVLFGDEYKNKFCEEEKIQRDRLDELLKQLNIFAKTTHTLGNYMPCPNGKYNKIKGNYYTYKDRIELLYEDIKEEPWWSDWYNEMKEKLELADILENKELLNFEFKGHKMKKVDIVPYIKYIKIINELIEKRGKVLADMIMKTSSL